MTDVSGTFMREMHTRKKWRSRLEQYSVVVVNVTTPINFDVIVGEFNDPEPKASPITYDIVNLTTGISRSRSSAVSYRCRLYKVNNAPVASQILAAYKEILHLLKESHGLASIIYHYTDEYLRLIVQLSINGVDINSMLISRYGFVPHGKRETLPKFLPHYVTLSDVFSDDEEEFANDDYSEMLPRSDKPNWRKR